MIEPFESRVGKALGQRLPPSAIAFALVLLVSSNIALAQQKGPGRARNAVTNVQFVAGNSALNIPFDFEFNEIVLRVRVNNSAPLKFLFKVSGIAEKSPAAEVGISAGDEIVGINGQPASQFTSSQIEQLLKRNGVECSLTLRRDGKTRVVKIKLRRSI